MKAKDLLVMMVLGALGGLAIVATNKALGAKGDRAFVGRYAEPACPASEAVEIYYFEHPSSFQADVSMDVLGDMELIAYTHVDQIGSGAGAYASNPFDNDYLSWAPYGNWVAITVRGDLTNLEIYQCDGSSDPPPEAPAGSGLLFDIQAYADGELQAWEIKVGEKP